MTKIKFPKLNATREMILGSIFPMNISDYILQTEQAKKGLRKQLIPIAHEGEKRNSQEDLAKEILAMFPEEKEE